MIRFKPLAVGSFLTLLLATLAHAVFVLPSQIVVPVRADQNNGTGYSDIVHDGTDTPLVGGGPASSVELAFSDLISGPDVGLGDGLGSGVIVTVWGYGLGSSQGASLIEFCDSASVCRVPHIYYWKDADGVAPSGPANLFESHGMQEIAFSIPDSASGPGNIRVTVSGNTDALPFIVRSGNIYHVMPAGSNSNPGTFAQPWQTAARVGHTQSGGTTAPAGSTVYFHGVSSINLSGRGMYINNSAATAPDATTNFSYISYPGAHSLTSGIEGFTNYQIQGTAISKFRVLGSNCTEIANGQRTGCVGTATWGIRADKWGRAVGNYLSEPDGRCSSGTHAAIIGNADFEDNVSSMKILGNEIEQYGCASSSALHHTTYLSIRSAPEDLLVTPWEFGWNYLHDNHAKSGIHQFDQDAGCGDLSGPIMIRNNVVINQAGPGIYVGGQCGWTADAYIENNVVINSGLPVNWNGVDQNSGQQEEPGNITIRDSGTPPDGGYLGTIHIKNNILWGVGWDSMGSLGQGCIALTGTADNVPLVMSHNVCINTRNYPFTGATNTAAAKLDNFTGGHNVWYWAAGGTPGATPTWDATPIITDPLITRAGNRITVGSGSPVIDQSNTSLLRDIYGTLRSKPNSNIGAVE